MVVVVLVALLYMGTPFERYALFANSTAASRLIRLGPVGKEALSGGGCDSRDNICAAGRVSFPLTLLFVCCGRWGWISGSMVLECSMLTVFIT